MGHRAKTNLMFVATLAYFALLAVFPVPTIVVSVLVFFYLALDVIIA